MRQFLCVAALCLVSGATSCFGQGFFEPIIATTTNSACVPGALCPILAIPGATVKIYITYPTALATTYSDSTLDTTCPTFAQLVTSAQACVPAVDNQGNSGVWITAGVYYYTVTTTGGVVNGPYAITIPGSGNGYILDVNYISLQSACSAAIKSPLWLTRNWNQTTTQTLNCSIVPAGGIIQPAVDQKVTITGGISDSLLQIFDTSLAGFGSIILNQAYARPEWFGAAANNTMVDSALGISSALNSLPSADGGLHWHGMVEFIAGATYYVKSQPAGATANFSLNIPQANGILIKGNGAVLNTDSLATNIGVMNSSTLPLSTGQTCGGGTIYDCQYQYEGAMLFNGVAMSPANPGDSTITVADGTKFTVGHAIAYQGGSNAPANTEPNSEMNIVTAISGDVLSLKYPVAKTMPSGIDNSSWPTVATDVDYLTTKNLEIDDLNFSGAGGDEALAVIGSFYTKLNNTSCNIYVCDFGNGYNRQMYWDHTVWMAGPTSAGGAGGGMFQVARSSADDYVENSSFLGYRNTIINFIAVTEGSYNFHALHNQFIGNGEVGVNNDVPTSGFDIQDNDFYMWGSLFANGMLDTTCCGGTSPSNIFIGNNRFHNYNTVETTMNVGGPGAIIQGNKVDALNATSTTAVGLGGMVMGQFIGNIIHSGGGGVTVSNGDNFPFIGNTINGTTSTATNPNANCILFNDNTVQAAGPILSQNTCNNFYNGIHGNALTNFPNRQVGFNTVTGATVPYIPTGWAPIDWNGGCSQVLLNGAQCSGLIASGVSLFGPVYNRSAAGVSGATPIAGAAYICDSTSVCIWESAVANGSSATYDARSPDGSISQIQLVPNATGGINLNFNGVTDFSFSAAGAWVVKNLPTSAPGTHCSVWSNSGVLTLTTCP